MGRTVTYVTEILVGLACVGLAVLTWRRRGRWPTILAVVLAVAGVVAVGHAVVRLAQ